MTSISDTHKNALKRAFEDIDINKTGHIDKSDIRTVLQLSGQNPTSEEMFTYSDTGESGQMTLEELYEFVEQNIKMKTPEQIDKELASAFEKFKDGKDPCISKEELRKVMTKFGDEPLTEKDADTLIDTLKDIENAGRYNTRVHSLTGTSFNYPFKEPATFSPEEKKMLVTLRAGYYKFSQQVWDISGFSLDSLAADSQVNLTFYLQVCRNIPSPPSGCEDVGAVYSMTSDGKCQSWGDANVAIFDLNPYQDVYTLVLLIDKGSSNQNTDSCSSKAISVKEDECFARYNLSDAFVNGLPYPLFLSYSKYKMNTLCTNIEDITECIKDAMGSCNHTYFDYNVYRKTLETICSNQQELKTAETNCNITILGICLKYYRDAVVDLKKHVHVTHPVTADLCRIFRNTRECILIEESTSCHLGHSKLLTSLYRNRFRSILCDDSLIDRAPVFISSVTLLFVISAIHFLCSYINIG
ncbi:hypothetical protein ACF0H5_010717 [Mactra antiquata]